MQNTLFKFYFSPARLYTYMYLRDRIFSSRVTQKKKKSFKKKKIGEKKCFLSYVLSKTVGALGHGPDFPPSYSGPVHLVTYPL